MDFCFALRAASGGALLFFLSGCDVTQSMAIDKGKEMVASSVKDPGSTTFQGVYMVEGEVFGDRHSGVLCGSINSKNSFGGFTGYRRFVADLRYSKQGEISLNNLQIEEGRYAETKDDGATYFESSFWLGRCVPKPAIPVAAVIDPPQQEKTESVAAPGALKPATPTAKPIKLVVPVKPVKWSIQVASIADANKAEAIRSEVANAGMPSYVVRQGDISRIFVGPYSSKSEAEGLINGIWKRHFLKGFLVVDKR